MVAGADYASEYDSDAVLEAALTQAVNAAADTPSADPLLVRS